MFGFIRVNAAELSGEEMNRYRALYCGLCRTLGKRHGRLSQLALTYDMTYLCLFLSSLYEPEEEQGMLRCLPHPAKPHPYCVNGITDYAADMTIALTWHKCMDDWQDDHKRSRKLMADALKKHYEAVKARWPRQVESIEARMQELSLIEARKEPSLDAAANCFGQLLGEIFVMKDDFWRGALRTFGAALGRYIYLADAACDYDKDAASGSYNPLLLLDMQPEDMREHLKQILGAASVAFEALPLITDEHLLRNVLYSGLWQSYNEAMDKRKGGKPHD